MGTHDDGRVGQEEKAASEFRLALLNQAMDLVRKALQEGRPSDAVQLLRDNANDTKATAAALLSAWQSFVGHIKTNAEQPEPATMPDLAAYFIHVAYNRMRRKHYRDRQMAQQVAQGQVCSPDGELLPFDPADPKQREECLKTLPLEIGEVLGKRSTRDRLVIELWMEEYTGKQIVEKIQGVLPGKSISQPTVSRIIERFRDEMGGRPGD